MNEKLELLKDRLAAELELENILDILQIEERELLDYLDDLIIENQTDLQQALD